jgi:hypothetical protein
LSVRGRRDKGHGLLMSLIRSQKAYSARKIADDVLQDLGLMRVEIHGGALICRWVSSIILVWPEEKCNNILTVGRG